MKRAFGLTGSRDAMLKSVSTTDLGAMDKRQYDEIDGEVITRELSKLEREVRWAVGRDSGPIK